MAIKPYPVNLEDLVSPEHLGYLNNDPNYLTESLEYFEKEYSENYISWYSSDISLALCENFAKMKERRDLSFSELVVKVEALSRLLIPKIKDHFYDDSLHFYYLSSKIRIPLNSNHLTEVGIYSCDPKHNELSDILIKPPLHHMIFNLIRRPYRFRIFVLWEELAKVYPLLEILNEEIGLGYLNSDEELSL